MKILLIVLLGLMGCSVHPERKKGLAYLTSYFDDPETGVRCYVYDGRGISCVKAK